MLDLTYIRSLSEIDSSLANLLASAPAAPPPSGLQEMREISMAKLRASIADKKEGVTERHITLPYSDGTTATHIVVSPTDMSKHSSHPLVVLFFGGGFILNGPEQMVPYARSLALLFGVVTVCGAYRLAPEHPFPTQSKDGWDVLKWVAANAKTELGADPAAGFIVGGASAGGNIVAVLAQKAKDENLSPPLTGQYIGTSIFFSSDTVPEEYRDFFISREQNAEAPVLNKGMVEMMMGAWNPDWSSPWCSPINSKSGVKGLPKTYSQVCGLDMLRDDGLIYDEMLKKAGVETKLDVYPGLSHAFWAFFPQLEATREALIDVAVGFGWLLGKQVDREAASEAVQAPNSA